MGTAAIVRGAWPKALAALLASVAFALVPATAAAVVPPAPPSGEGEGGEEQQPAEVVLAPDRTGALTPAAPLTWAGAVATATNRTFQPLAPGTCNKAPATYCDITLVDVQPGDFYSEPGRGVQFSTAGANPGTDLDLFVYESDATGRVGALVGVSGGLTDVERVPVLGATGHHLVVVVYFTAVETGYVGAAEFFRRSTVAPDVDTPRGMRDILVSRPGRGFRSHSEPHLSQDPTRPSILVGGSKMYNRDRDSLAEYEFKIGTYASFDRGRTWTDLGQLNACPLAQAPPRTWPLRNTCYPEDDPARAGTGPEDAAESRRGGDFGEEYTTSDVWTDFDDEGNAYAMILDAPPYSGDSTSNGFGMSFHRWPTPSAEDVRRGRTWSPRIPINAYTTPRAQASTLDDKNTFAVNNAGPDGDGRTGIIVACWGRNDRVEASARQFIVCERSVDAGRTWPDDPQPISPPLNPPLPVGPFVVGIHVIADERDPRTFYAVWLDTLVGAIDGSGVNAFWFTRTTDGARTWEPARVIARVPTIPGIFPRQAFRNLSLPIMASGRRGEVYIAYADYNPAPSPDTDEDGLQADIKLLRSPDSGRTWSGPTRVNTDVTNADQFQPYLRVTRRGQLNVVYFDRRFDVPQPPEHPGNFFVDTVLARSADGGRTWREIRLSHDAWDPSLNAPLSPSGEFIGDYQGLVADDCYAIPFVNDSHLGNAAGRDPGLSGGEPRSPFQQIVAWRVPNRPGFGGGRPDC
jgi:hypothetical protein